MMTDVVIVSAARTPIGALGGSLKDVTAVELGTVAAKAAIARSGLDAAEIDQAIIGNVLQANNGQNVARQIALRSGLDTSSTAMTVNEVCGSGLKAVRLGQAAIILGDADIVLVGGTESMSGAPYYAPACGSAISTGAWNSWTASSGTACPTPSPVSPWG